MSLDNNAPDGAPKPSFEHQKPFIYASPRERSRKLAEATTNFYDLANPLVDDLALVRLGSGKKPKFKGHMDERPTGSKVARYISSKVGYGVGVRPASLGCVVFDVDDGDVMEAAKVLDAVGVPVLCVTPSSSGKKEKGHIWVKVSGAPGKNGNFCVVDPISEEEVGRGQFRTTVHCAQTPESLAVLTKALCRLEDLEPIASKDLQARYATAKAKQAVDLEFDRSAGREMSQNELSAFEKRRDASENRSDTFWSIVNDIKAAGVSFDNALEQLAPVFAQWEKPDGGTTDADFDKYEGKLETQLANVWSKCPPYVDGADDFDDADDDLEVVPEAQPAAKSGTQSVDAPERQTEHKPKAKKKRERTLLWPHELADLKPPEYLVQGLIQIGTIVGIVGPPRSFKSFVVNYMAQSLAAGKAPWGRPPDKPTPMMVVTIAGEGGAGYNARIDAWNTTHLFNDTDDGGMEARRSERHPRDKMDDLPMHLVRPVATNLADQNAVEPIVEEIEWVREKHFPECRILVVFDTFSANFIGEENSNQVATAIKTCKSIRDRLRAPVRQEDGSLEEEDATVVIVHHTGKDERKGGRGHSSFKGDVDAEITVWRTHEDAMEAVVWVEKMKDDEDQWGLQVQLERVDIWIRGEKKTSLVVLDDAEYLDKKPAKDGGGNGQKSKAHIKEEMLSILKDHFATEGAPPLTRKELMVGLQSSLDMTAKINDHEPERLSDSTFRRYLHDISTDKGEPYTEKKAESGNKLEIVKI